MSLFSKIKSIRTRWWVLSAGVIAAGLLIFSRTEKHETYADVSADPELTPTMTTINATSLISDSGYTRYSIKAPVWLIYDEAKQPNWKFNKGMYCEQYDDAMKVIATFMCDSAIFLTTPKLWEFIGNVRMKNTNGDKFLTQQMYWDTEKHKMYSDSFIHIEKADRIIEGYGFNSDERIQNYTVNHPSMILPISDFNIDGSSRRDSPATSPAQPRPIAPAPTESGTPGNPAVKKNGRSLNTREIREWDGAQPTRRPVKN